MKTPTSCVTVNHSRVNPVFVVGYPRSGTSLMCRLLLDHLGVNFGPKASLSSACIGAWNVTAIFARPPSASAFEDLSEERFFERTTSGSASTSTRRARTRASSAVSCRVRRESGSPEIGGQDASADLPVLRQLFPDAQYLHIVRDGRDAAASMMRTAFGAKTALEAAREWTGAVGRIQRFGRELPPDHFLEVRYEDLIANPAEALRRVARRLPRRRRTQENDRGADYSFRAELLDIGPRARVAAPDRSRRAAASRASLVGWQPWATTSTPRFAGARMGLGKARSGARKVPYRRLRNRQVPGGQLVQLRLRARHANFSLRVLAGHRRLG